MRSIGVTSFGKVSHNPGRGLGRNACHCGRDLHDARVKTQFLSRAACAFGFYLVFAGDLFARTRYQSHSSATGSSSGFVWLMILGLVVFFAGLVGLFFYLDRKRAEKIQAVATRLGYTFRRKPTDADKALIVGCHIANSGHGHITSNIVEAAHSEELRLTLFDHVYTVGYGKSSQQYNQTVTRMQAPVLNLPAFVLFPETFFSKVGKLFGGSDINFPEAPGFSKKFVLRGPDEAAIRAFFSPALIQFLERKQGSLAIDAAGDTLFVHRTAKRAKPEEIEAYVAEGKEILAQFFDAQNSSRSMVAPPPLPPPMPV